jgi:hypothetical protein
MYTHIKVIFFETIAFKPIGYKLKMFTLVIDVAVKCEVSPPTWLPARVE